LPALVVLVRRLGYDDLLAGAIGLAGAAAGFSGAFLNPFTIGVGQAITGLPLFSGIGFRLVVWLVVTIATTIWISRAARRLRLPVSPEASGEVAPSAAVVALTPPHRLVLLALLTAIVLLVIGALSWNW